MRLRHIIASLLISACYSVTAQFSSYDIGKPPDSTSNWILGIEHNPMSVFYTLGKWQLYGIDTIYINDGDSLCIRLESDTLRCIELTGGGGSDTHFYDTDLTATDDRTHDQANYGVTINSVGSWMMRPAATGDPWLLYNQAGEVILNAGAEIGVFNGLHSVAGIGAWVGVGNSLSTSGGLGFNFNKFASQADFYLNDGGINRRIVLHPLEVQFQSNGLTFDGTYRFLDKPPFEQLDTVITMDEDGYLKRSLMTGGAATCDSLHFFTDDDDAKANGYNQGSMYLLDQDDTYGLAWGVVKFVTEGGDMTSIAVSPCIAEWNTPLLFYEDDDDAGTVGGLSIGDYYLLSADNLYGMPHGIPKQKTL